MLHRYCFGVQERESFKGKEGRNPFGIFYCFGENRLGWA